MLVVLESIHDGQFLEAINYKFIQPRYPEGIHIERQFAYAQCEAMNNDEHDEL